MSKTTVNHVNGTVHVDTTADAVIVPQADAVFSIVLDVTDFVDDVIQAGHTIFKASDGKYKPSAVSNGVLSAIPGGATYVGVLSASILKSKPIAAVTQKGIVNREACKYKPLSAAETALKHILFTSDV